MMSSVALKVARLAIWDFGLKKIFGFMPPPLVGGINPKYSLRCVRCANVNPKSKRLFLKNCKSLQIPLNPPSKGGL